MHEIVYRFHVSCMGLSLCHAHAVQYMQEDMAGVWEEVCADRPALEVEFFWLLTICIVVLGLFPFLEHGALRGVGNMVAQMLA